MNKLIIALLLTSCYSFAQTTNPSFVATGASFSRYSVPEMGYWASFVVQTGLASGRTYSFTTVDAALKSTSIRTGIAFAVLHEKSVYFMATSDVGGTSILSAAAGSFSVGPMVVWTLNKLLVIGRVRMIGIAGQPLRPSYELGIGWTLN